MTITMIIFIKALLRNCIADPVSDANCLAVHTVR